jgi:hypothetical protein
MQARDQTAYRQLERTVLLEIEALTTRIRELSHQKYSLEQILIRARQQSEFVTRTDVTRKNSINRALVEGSVLQALAAAKKPIRVKNLFANAQGVTPSLRENTFRSHLFRMKKRGLVTSPTSGMWQLGAASRQEQLAASGKQA